MRILAIIPAYNEEGSIAYVIKQIKSNSPGIDIVVINDGSKDSTSAKALISGATVVDLPVNLGIGGAMQTGYLYAKKNSYDIAIQIDGDGQHDSAYIHRLIKPVMEGKADMVIGSRFMKKTYYRAPITRRAGMIFFSLLVRILTNKKICDTTSGFRVVNKRIVNYFADSYPTDYPEVDVLVRLYRRRFRILEVPVEMRPRKTGKSSITPLRSIYYMVKVTICLLIGSLGLAEK